MINYRKSFIAGMVAGIVLWLGLSPRIATPLYEAVLMPRYRNQDLDKMNSAEVSRVHFVARGIKLEGMLYKHPDSQKIVLYCGGRRSNFAKLALPAKALLRIGVSVFVWEPAGFGDAGSRASLHGLVAAGLSAYDVVVSLGYAEESIVLYGESLGAAVATYVTERRAASGLILQSGFSSLARLLRVFPTALYPQPRLANSASLKRGHPPLLIVHGDEDDVVNVAHAHRLATAAQGNTTLAILSGAGHYALHSRSDWFEAVSAFLRSL
jgi:alpha-beta hydrolase superfamily lysophospholipase